VAEEIDKALTKDDFALPHVSLSRKKTILNAFQPIGEVYCTNKHHSAARVVE
jgi:hypothetical protein